MSKFYNIYKQFGVLYLIKAFFKRLISPIVKMTSFYILAIENHQPDNYNQDIKIIDANNLDLFLKSDVEISKQLEQQLLSFVPQKTIAIIVIRDHNIAGWGYVQKSGISKYGGYNYNIPKGTHLLKNLFVNPIFRGQSIGKHINKFRINHIPETIIPTVFVIPSNTYAIRNLEMYGFRKQVFVKDYLWFNKYHTRALKAISKNKISDTIISGFKNE